MKGASAWNAHGTTERDQDRRPDCDGGRLHTRTPSTRTTALSLLPDLVSILHSAAMAHSNRRPLRPPSAEELYQVREYSSRLEYAFKVRPPVAAKSRRRWEIHFKQDLYRLITVLGSATFDELPAFAIGCVWEHNRRRQPGAEPFDIETIRAADKEHPARKNGPGRLRYQPARDGPNGLLPEQGLKSIWWDEFRQRRFFYICGWIFRSLLSFRHPYLPGRYCTSHKIVIGR